jgi:hypothetical protein
MLGMIAAVALLASADDQIEIAPPVAPLGGQEQHVDGAGWSGGAAGMGALGVVSADLLTVMAGAALFRLAPVKCSSTESFCINETATIVTLVGLIALPPTLALVFAQKGTWDGRAVAWTLLAQVAAIACIAGAASSSNTAAMAFVASAAAFHFVGIPLAAGLVTARPAPGAASEGAAPTLSLALRW